MDHSTSSVQTSNTTRKGALRSAPAERSPFAPSTRLDRNTLLDRLKENQPAERRFRMRLWKKSGVVQLSWGTYKPEQKKPGGRAMSEAERVDNQKRAGARAVAQIRRDLLTITADRMLTLTYRQNMTDRSKALADLIRFNRAMKTRFENWASVAVLEWQQRGSAHFHLGISGFYPVSVIREVWLSIVGEGNIDIAFKPDGRGNQYSKLASYMGKYLAKDLDEGRKPGEHRYFRCQIPAHPSEVYYIPAGCPLGTERGMVFEALQAAFGFSDLSMCSVWVSPSGLCGGGFASAEVNSSTNKKGV